MPDEYEAAYMAGDGAVLHRQKARIPTWAIGLAAGLPALLALGAGVGLAAAGVLGLAGALGIAGGAAAYAVLMSGVMVVTGVSRVSVSEGELHVQMGTGALRVPIAEIEHASLGPSGTRKRGIGKRLLRDGTRVYTMMGDPGRAVLITRRGGPPLALVCPDPEGLLAALEAARAPSRLARVRVDAAEEPAEDEVSPTPASTEARRERDAP